MIPLCPFLLPLPFPSFPLFMTYECIFRATRLSAHDFYFAFLAMTRWELHHVLLYPIFYRLFRRSRSIRRATAYCDGLSLFVLCMFSPPYFIQSSALGASHLFFVSLLFYAFYGHTACLMGFFSCLLAAGVFLLDFFSFAFESSHSKLSTAS